MTLEYERAKTLKKKDGEGGKGAGGDEEGRKREAGTGGRRKIREAERS